MNTVAELIELIVVVVVLALALMIFLIGPIANYFFGKNW